MGKGRRKDERRLLTLHSLIWKRKCWKFCKIIRSSKKSSACFAASFRASLMDAVSQMQFHCKPIQTRTLLQLLSLVLIWKRPNKQRKHYFFLIIIQTDDDSAVSGNSHSIAHGLWVGNVEIPFKSLCTFFLLDFQWPSAINMPDKHEIFFQFCFLQKCNCFRCIIDGMWM